MNFIDTSKIEGSWSSGTLTLSVLSGQSPTNALNTRQRFVRSPIRIRIQNDNGW